MNANTPIAFASDANFIEQLKTASYSAVYACRSGCPGLDLHILDCGISDGVWDDYCQGIRTFAEDCGVSVVVTRHPVDMSLFASCPVWTNGSKATWARILLPDVLQGMDGCVYSDCDILFLENPSAILDAIRQTGALMVGHRNPFGENNLDRMWFSENRLPYEAGHYLCAGLIGLNLCKMRELNFREAVRSFLKKYPRPATNDQAVLNWFCHGRTSLLEDGWGLFPHECMAYDGELKALHLSGGYPWSRVKNAYDWVCRHCSRKETALVNDFRCRIMKAKPFSAEPASIENTVVGWSLLQLTRFLNRLGIGFPGHPSFSELVAAFDGKGVALSKVVF